MGKPPPIEKQLLKAQRDENRAEKEREEMQRQLQKAHAREDEAVRLQWEAEKVLRDMLAVEERLRYLAPQDALQAYREIMEMPRKHFETTPRIRPND